MDEIERMVLIDNIIWIGGLVAPVIVGIITALIARQPRANRVRVCYMGSLAAFALGTIGSYVAGETILNALGSVGDLPWHLFLQGWHRMWYPLGIGIIVGVALALFALLPGRSAAEPALADRR